MRQSEAAFELPTITSKEINGSRAFSFTIQGPERTQRDFYYFYLQTCISTPEKKNQGQDCFSKLQSLPSNPICQNTFNVANYQTIKREKIRKTSFPLFSGS